MTRTSPKRIRAWLAALALAVVVAAPPASSAQPPAEAGTHAGRRALVISIDGLRPDLLLRAETPALRGLMARGSFTMWAQTTFMAVTLPSHVSMLTGVTPPRHGIVWNTDDLPLARPVYPRTPTLFELAHRAGLTTAMAAGKSKFSALVKPGTLDWSLVPASSTFPDSVVTDTAVRWIESHRPRVLFVHLPQVDGAGHDHGYGSAAQLVAVARADRCVARLLEALGRQGLDSTLVVVTADHGGTAGSHGAEDVRSRTIPWIAAGPGVRRNLDLATLPKLEVRIEDTFATVCDWLGLGLPKDLDGRPVREAMEQPGAARRR